MAKCYYCKGETTIKKIDVDFLWGDQLFVFKKVPVEVCTRCGEKYYSAEISHKFDQLVKEANNKTRKPEKILEVPVFSFS